MFGCKPAKVGLRLSFSLVMCLQQARGTNRRHQSLRERRVDIRNQESLIRGGSALRSNSIFFYIPFLNKIKNPSRIYTLYFPSTNGSPFVYLFQNTASLLAVVSAVFFLFFKNLRPIWGGASPYAQFMVGVNPG